MKYVLKQGQENFDVVDGPLAGRRYVRGVEYDESAIPEGEKTRFEKVREPAKKAVKPAADQHEGGQILNLQKEGGQISNLSPSK